MGYRIIMKNVGSGSSNLTLNQDYEIIGFAKDGGGEVGILVNDIGELLFESGITNAADWQLVSVSTLASTSVYP